jgi:hypothetical protein
LRKHSGMEEKEAERMRKLEGNIALPYEEI